VARAVRTASKRAFGLVAILVVWVAVAELVLQLACLSPRVETIVTGTGPQPLVPDARLGLRGNDAYPDHDEWGYRNAARPERAEVVALGDSILTPLYRREVVDYRDPRIEAGLAVIRTSLARIAERCRESGPRLVVVFIPTKENVFAGRIPPLETRAPLPQLVADEEALKRTLIADLEDLDVEDVDLLGPLRAAPAQPYFEDLDGHPSAAGHEAIAAEIDRILQEDLITARSR